MSKLFEGVSPAEPRLLHARAGRSRIVLEGPRTVTNEGLRRALDSHAPGYDVVLVDHPSQVEPAEVALVILQWEPSRAVDESLSAWRQCCPDAAIALIVDLANGLVPKHEELFEQGQIQGILPLRLDFDIYIAAVGLLLSGGDYYPAALTRARRSLEQSARDETPGNGLGQRPSVLQDLTARQIQILELMSVGMQNKSIASRMQLSEHTVKVHVHNVIQKLRVSNRTQAAALFRRQADDDRFAIASS